jgi:hypothetical protein
MTLSAGLIHRSASSRPGDRPRHRLKSGPFPLGANRFRLLQALDDLGLYAERIVARLREERRRAQLLDAHRLVGLRDEERARELVEAHRLARLQEERRALASREARLREEERAALSVEHHQFLLLLKEELAFQSMTDEQRTADRLEEQILLWLSSRETGA